MNYTYPIRNRASELTDQLIQWRRWLHTNPELSFQEYNTAHFITQILNMIPGMEVKTGVAKTGVVATLSSGTGPTIALRADMDALPILEQTNHSFSSLNEGIMHACGHDAHTAILLGTAYLLGEVFQKEKMKGTVKFIFQPAEEEPDEDGLTGACYLLQEGVLQGVDVAIALHMDPANPVGAVRIHDHYSMANVDIFEGVIRATGGHAAYPHLGTDPIWMLSTVLQVLNGIVSRKISPLEPAVVSITQIEAGKAANVLPDKVTVRGTMRSYHPDVRDKLIAEITAAFAVVEKLGGDYSCQLIRGEPALKNHPTVNDWIKRTIKDLYPTFTICPEPYGLGGEDFGYITEKVPGAMFFLGCAIPDGVQRDLHTPIFDIDEASLPIGTAILAETVIRYLQGIYTPIQTTKG